MRDSFEVENDDQLADNKNSLWWFARHIGN
jgi:hypothetical protein